MLGIFLAVYIASLDEVPLILLGTVKSNSFFSGPKQQRGKADIFPHLQKMWPVALSMAGVAHGWYLVI